ncbi:MULTISPECIES: hypothetical protein [Aquimarina]|uniref:Uncharacterized protein n=1 Tax=Aquimarina algiphila TaxID=2047982 RepID=A0A554VRP1_9FLAO|nr:MULTISPECIES: hypothetical protein [Aquimarina]TSE11334.1 hypothetical protein FOF46_01510 [Aquimarina algiphila]
MDIENINIILNKIFKGLSISNINYSIDFWNLEFSRHLENEFYEFKELNKIVLTAHEIEVCNEIEWKKTISKGPFDISDSVDYEESIKAMILFHLARLPIESVEIKKNADLFFKYSKNRFLKINGIVEIVDWVWWLDIEQNEKIIMSEFGKIACDEKILKSTLK